MSSVVRSSSSSRFGKTKRSLAANAQSTESVVVRLVLSLERLALARVNRDPVTNTQECLLTDFGMAGVSSKSRFGA